MFWKLLTFRSSFNVIWNKNTWASYKFCIDLPIQFGNNETKTLLRLFVISDIFFFLLRVLFNEWKLILSLCSRWLFLLERSKTTTYKNTLSEDKSKTKGLLNFLRKIIYDISWQITLYFELTAKLSSHWPKYLHRSHIVSNLFLNDRFSCYRYIFKIYLLFLVI